MTASEVFDLIARIEGTDGRPTATSLRVADRDARALARLGRTIRRTDWRLVGRNRADGGLSLADAHAVALAHERRETLVVGAGRDVDALPVDVTVERVGG